MRPGLVWFDTHLPVYLSTPYTTPMLCRLGTCSVQKFRFPALPHLGICMYIQWYTMNGAGGREREPSYILGPVSLSPYLLYRQTLISFIAKPSPSQVAYPYYSQRANASGTADDVVNHGAIDYCIPMGQCDLRYLS